MRTRNVVLIVAVCAALGLGGCGDDGDGGEAEEKATPAQAVQEIAKVRTELDRAVTQLERGDRKGAEETVSEAYLEHFEKVEGPLEDADPKLNEELEESISGDLRARIRGGAPAAEVERMVAEVKADLATAESKLS